MRPVLTGHRGTFTVCAFEGLKDYVCIRLWYFKYVQLHASSVCVCARASIAPVIKRQQSQVGQLGEILNNLLN